jgi:hypothetical protein
MSARGSRNPCRPKRLSRKRDLDGSQSLTTAFLLLMERLTPKERAAFLLREVFGKSLSGSRQHLGIDGSRLPPACFPRRKVRAQDIPRSGSPPRGPAASILAAFHNALKPDRLTGLGAAGATVSCGRMAAARRRPFAAFWKARRIVGRYIAGILGRLVGARSESPARSTATAAWSFWRGTRPTAMTLGYAPKTALVDRIYIIRNPDKLARLERPPATIPCTGSLKLN